VTGPPPGPADPADDPRRGDNGPVSELPDFRVTLDRAGRGEPGHPTRSDIQLLSPELYADPDERFAWMRTNAPVYWDDATGIWGLASHEAVRYAAKHWQTFCSGQGSRPDSSVPSMINMDAPQHSFRRGIVKDGFTVRRVDAHEPYLRAKVGELLDAAADMGECDLVSDIATPLPMFMIGTLMGLPESDHAQLLHWSDLFAAGDVELLPQIEEAVLEWNDYILAHAREVRGRGNDDLISLMCDAERDGQRLTDVDLMFESMLVLVGGDETTRHVISAGAEALLRHPDQLALLRADPDLIPTAVEEMLRWSTPVKNMNRTATRDVELFGQQLQEGDRMLLLYPSANRDEAVFDDPYRFDVRRDPNPHVAFGAYGRHHCLGAPLARLELKVLFEELLDRFDEIELVDPDRPARQRRGNFVVGLETLPVRLGARGQTSFSASRATTATGSHTDENGGA
jgi:cholest-4-en-3-one 26-monooxygenase